MESGGGRDNLVEPTVAEHEIRIQWARERIDNATIKNLYLASDISAREVAAKVGLPKTTVIRRLQAMGVSKKGRRRC